MGSEVLVSRLHRFCVLANKGAQVGKGRGKGELYRSRRAYQQAVENG